MTVNDSLRTFAVLNRSFNDVPNEGVGRVEVIEPKAAAMLLTAWAVLTSAAVQAQPEVNHEEVSSERWRAQIAQRCARSVYPTECEATGSAAYGAGQALFSCRNGRDPARQASFVARATPRGYATQSEIDMYCGDLVEACESSWRAFERRASARSAETAEPSEIEGIGERLADYCRSKPAEIYVD